MFEIARYQDQLLQLHDHICPRQVLGLRMAELAGEFFGLSLPQRDKSLFVFVETDGCFSDGVMVATGCSLGHRTMRLEDQGKVSATFVNMRQHTQSALRIWPHPEARQKAVEMAPSARSRWQAQLEAYQHLPTWDLLCSELVDLIVSMQAIISKPGIRTTCQICGEEIINEHSVIRDGMCLCRACAGVSRYYTAATPTNHPGGS